ncbi:hypothetical protein C8245_08240 [Paracidovorax avenae]|uniref:hypothetical protein n=1 Tax=Paracidovorax avenae TaxID=80867 RepID=UPI000D2245A0|nr:hypothetical protein [Paracidovorax avenae]AVS65675.1 hypothetical protein C8245_08240 [Paracidovorax avenae]
MGSGPAAALQGIYVGRLPNPETKEEDRLFEAPIGTVWKASVIDEIIAGGVFDVRSEEMVAGGKEIQVAVVADWPTDGLHHVRVLNIKGVDWNTTNSVMRVLNGRANPYVVREAAVEFANAERDRLQPS